MIGEATRGKNAPTIMAGAAVLSALVYYLFFIRPFGLLERVDQPLLDLFKLSKTDPHARERLITGYLVLGVLYWLGLRAAQQAHGRTAWGIVVGGALASATILLFLYPFGAADIFDNIMHGRILGVYGGNPFRDVIGQFDQDRLVAYTAWRLAPSAYGPAWELLAGGTAWLADWSIRLVRPDLDSSNFETLRIVVLTNVIAFKLLGAASLAASCLLVAVILRRFAPERAVAGVLLLAWNPVVLVETIGHGHNDLAMMAWVLAATWALTNRRFTLAILALVIGGLVKYLPVLMVPAAGLIALRALPDHRIRLRFVAMTGFAALVLVAAAYVPFWVGPETLSIERRQELFTSSLPAVAWAILQKPWGAEVAGARVSLAAAGLTAVFAVWQALRTARDASWLSFPRAAFAIVVFYLLLTCLWFQNWYALWALALAALFPVGYETRLAMLLGYAGLAKPLIFEPLWLWQRPLPPKAWREMRLGPAVLALPWVYALYAWMKTRQSDHSR